MDSLVVALRQGVQLALLTAIGRHLRLALQLAQLFQVHVMRMQGEARRDVIGIGVVPASVGRGVVDGQQLDNLHTRRHRPVDHPSQVAEVAHAVGMLAAEREHGDDHTSGPPRLLLQVQQVAIEHAHLAVGNLFREQTVVALLPCYEFMRLLVYHNILILYGQADSIHIDRQEPVLLSDILHRQITDGTPAAHHRMAAQDGQRLAFLQLWSRNAEECCLTIERHATGLSGLAMLRVFRGQIGIGIEVGAQGHIPPLVVEHIVLGRVKPVSTRHLRPLAAQHPPVAIFHLVSV